MKKALLLPILVMAVTASAIQGSDPTVYKTRTGDKYHVAGCRYLRKSKLAIKLSEAKIEGPFPCKVCEPQ